MAGRSGRTGRGRGPHPGRFGDRYGMQPGLRPVEEEARIRFSKEIAEFQASSENGGSIQNTLVSAILYDVTR